MSGDPKRVPLWGPDAAGAPAGAHPTTSSLGAARVVGLVAFVAAEGWQLLWAGGSAAQSAGTESRLLFLACWVILLGYAACIWGSRAGLALAAASVVALTSIVIVTATMGVGGGPVGVLTLFGPAVALAIGIITIARIRRREAAWVQSAG